MYGDLNAMSSELDNTPHQINKSKLFIKSIGRAAMNIDDNNPKLEIIPLEDLGYVDGEINTDKQKIEASGNDHNGNAYNVSVNTSNTILATWLPLNTNRLTVPHVRRGERVLIWQYGDTDEYYWQPMGLDDNLRKLETITHAVSNTKDEGDVKLTTVNTYSWEISTHKGLVTLQTSKSNNEAFKYTVQINTKGDHLTITDDADNFIEIDSAQSSVTLHNTAGSLLQVIGGVINITSNDTVNIQTKAFNVEASNTKIKSNVSTTGSLSNNSVNVGSSHAHKDVKRGNDNSGTPV